MLSLMVIIRRWRLPTICITVRTLSIQSDILACASYNMYHRQNTLNKIRYIRMHLHWATHPPTDGNQRSMQAWLFSDHLCCRIIHMNTKNLSTLSELDIKIWERISVDFHHKFLCDTWKYINVSDLVPNAAETRKLWRMGHQGITLCIVFIFYEIIRSNLTNSHFCLILNHFPMQTNNAMKFNNTNRI